MRYRVFKSLDDPSSLFGIKGPYVKWVAVGLVIAAGVGLLIGEATIGLVGIMVFVLLGAIWYLTVRWFQDRFTEKERKQLMTERKLPDRIVVPPVPFCEYVTREFTNTDEMLTERTE